MVAQRQAAQLNAPSEHRWDTDVTQIIPINEFGAASGLVIDRGYFATDAEVLSAPELDDLNDLEDEWPRYLLGPISTVPPPALRRPASGVRLAAEAGVVRYPATSARVRRAPSTSHRRKAEAAGALHSRVIIAAFATGAITAAANASVETSEARADPVVLADAAGSLASRPDDASGLQIVPVVNGVDSAVHQEELARGVAFAQERAQREARLRRPQFVFPARGDLTSGFGTRWGTLHGGLDIANAIGTPIYAASDGQVIASGPTPGFGMWVKIRDAAGTVMLYGHIDTATVEVGERVLAGDQIATMGNRGNSTGPHLHFEVHLRGAEKTDPMSWLQERGVPGS